MDNADTLESKNTILLNSRDKFGMALPSSSQRLEMSLMIFSTKENTTAKLRFFKGKASDFDETASYFM